jgi:hypothetical protein
MDFVEVGVESTRGIRKKELVGRMKVRRIDVYIGVEGF